jgi:hypothetical protein
MSESLQIALIGIAGTIFAGLIGIFGGRWIEKRKQSLIIRIQLLEPIIEWLKGAEKLVGMFSDTLSSIAFKSVSPINYNFDERRTTANFMTEKTNEIFGILISNSLQIRVTKPLANELNSTIRSLDRLIKIRMLPLDSEILATGTLTSDIMKKAGELKLEIDDELQKAYSLIAQIKTAFS